MRNLSLTTIGAVCAILMFVSFAFGIVFMATGGVPVLIPETGSEGREWIADVNDAGGAFLVGAWLTIIGGYFGMVALIGFYNALRAAGRVLVLAPILGVVGLTLVTVSHLIPIAMAYELAPAYADASGASQASLATAEDTLAAISLVTNYAGNFLGWGVAIPMIAYAILTTSVVPRWIGWLGMVVAFFAGWLGLLGPASSVIEGISSIGFLAFFVFVLSMGIALLRIRSRSAAGGASAVSGQVPGTVER
jgi:hypothetical protein